MTYRDILRDDLPAALEAEPRAIERLLTAIRPIVVRYCRARLGSVDGSFAAADDVAREICLAVLSSLPGYPDDGRPFLAFLHEIVVETLSRDAGDRAGAPLDSLPAIQRDIVILRTVVGLSTEETAEAVGMSPGGVRLAQHRALRRLRTTAGG
ncbi:sigma factor-like helix-turn-helix DNA-binding protein [Actinophytocola sp.]|uniref:sigma factor-like helix-turn-helix DNA-binding protein n=1 Tax=Actinophytocola sp. TaxID=1872138 RepID=UPI003D6BEAEE